MALRSKVWWTADERTMRVTRIGNEAQSQARTRRRRRKKRSDQGGGRSSSTSSAPWAVWIDKLLQCYITSKYGIYGGDKRVRLRREGW